MSGPQRPADLVDVSPNGYVVTTPSASKDNNQAPVSEATPEVRPNDLVHVDSDYVAKQVDPMNKLTAAASALGLSRPMLEKAFGSDATGRRSMELYLKSQIHHKYPGLNLDALEKEMRAVSHPNERVATMHEVQDALKTMEGRGIPGVGPVDLSAYETVPKPTTVQGKIAQPFGKVGEYVENLNPLTGAGMGSKVGRAFGRGALGFGTGYEATEAYNKALEGDLTGAIPHASSAAGYGALLSTNPKVKGVGAVLAGLPLVGKLMGNAQAAPMTESEAAGTGFDLASSLLGPASLALTPSELGAGTVQRKREVYRPGMNVLQGSTLPPEQRAHGGLVHLAEGGASNTSPFIGYPHIKSKPRDPNFKQQSGPILGALDALIGAGPRSDISVLNPQDLKYSEAYDKFEPYGIAANVLPFMAGPMKAVGKTAARELGPKAADMAENYLTKIGGIQYAVPPSKGGDVIKASEALGKHENKYLGLTQTDNMGIHDGRQGGNRFPTLQQTSPVHAKDKPVWAMDSEKHAERLIDSAQDPNLIFSTYIGRPDQLKSNKTVFNDVMQQHYARNLTPEQIDLINNRIANVKDAKKRLIFPQAFDIRDKFAAQELGGDTFARRGKMADILGLGEGVGKTRGGIALPQYEDILRSHRDPLTEGVPTSSIGTQLFKVDPKRPTFETDKYHTDYRFPVFGENTGDTFAPFPHSMLDWHAAQVEKTGQVPHGNAWFNYMQTPQHLNEKFLTRLQKEGFAGGGKVNLLTDLLKHVEQQMGKRAALRVEQAADLVPNLERNYSQAGLMNAFAGDNNRPLMIMQPSKFEQYATPTIGKEQDYLNQLQDVAKTGGGFKDVPYLQMGLNKQNVPEILAHEGRHRSAALSQMGDQPSLVRLMPHSSMEGDIPRNKMIGDYLDAWEQKNGQNILVKPESYYDNLKQEMIKRKAIELPKTFKKGGLATLKKKK